MENWPLIKKNLHKWVLLVWKYHFLYCVWFQTQFIKLRIILLLELKCRMLTTKRQDRKNNEYWQSKLFKTSWAPNIFFLILTFYYKSINWWKNNNKSQCHTFFRQNALGYNNPHLCIKDFLFYFFFTIFYHFLKENA